MEIKHEIMLKEVSKLYDEHIKKIETKNGKVIITFKKYFDPGKPWGHLLREHFPGSDKIIADNRRLYFT